MPTLFLTAVLTCFLSFQTYAIAAMKWAPWFMEIGPRSSRICCLRFFKNRCKKGSFRSIYINCYCDRFDKGLCENGILFLQAPTLLGRLCFVYWCAVMLEQERAIHNQFPQSLDNENDHNALAGWSIKNSSHWNYGVEPNSWKKIPHHNPPLHQTLHLVQCSQTSTGLCWDLVFMSCCCSQSLPLCSSWLWNYNIIIFSSKKISQMD